MKITKKPTPFPAYDLYNDLLMGLAERFEKRYLKSINLDDLEKDVAREYYKNGCRPVCARMMQTALLPEWGFGESQDEIATRLGMDRSRVSDAKTKGELSLSAYLAIKWAEGRPSNVVPAPHEIAAMNRAGFIGVAKLLRGYVTDRPVDPIIELDEFGHELLCRMLSKYDKWTVATCLGQQSIVSQLAIDLINQTLVEADCDPLWSTDAQRLNRINLQVYIAKNSKHAVHHILHMQKHWEDVYVYTAMLTEVRIRYAEHPLAN